MSLTVNQTVNTILHGECRGSSIPMLPNPAGDVVGDTRVQIPGSAGQDVNAVRHLTLDSTCRSLVATLLGMTGLISGWNFVCHPERSEGPALALQRCPLMHLTVPSASSGRYSDSDFCSFCPLAHARRSTPLTALSLSKGGSDYSFPRTSSGQGSGSGLRGRRSDRLAV